ncbi:hypothetical protein C8R44DRAFT_974675 [Mycena epipterygia]|nr:hypothetical protein C8R44DRAFT_974675 [Mycena epipterygia]
MPRVGCVDNASIYGHQPLACKRNHRVGRRKCTEPHSCRYLPLPPASLHLRCGPLRAGESLSKRMESACFERVREFKTDGIVKKHPDISLTIAGFSPSSHTTRSSM